MQYSILFKGMSPSPSGYFNDGNQTFNYEVLGKIDRVVNMRVYDSYFNHLVHQEVLHLYPGINYYTYLTSNSKNRYVEFRDESTYKIVGLFGLDGESYSVDMDVDGYARRIGELVTPREKNNLYDMFNEIVYLKSYHNDFITVEDGDVVVDIGFNYGTFSIQSLRFNPSRVVAFEPNPKLVKLFKNNFQTGIIEIHQMAVSDKNGTTTFFENADNIMSTIIEGFNGASVENSYDVEVRDFNQILMDYKLDKIDYLKVDCEGSEYAIFQSIPIEYLRYNVRKITIEFHDRLSDPKVQSLIQKLKGAGFELDLKYEENKTIGLIHARKEKRIILIQLWLGPIPDYFWYHYDTVKKIEGIDFLFVTDQDITLDSKNHTVVKTTMEEIDLKLSDRLGCDIKIKNNKKISDLKAASGDLFSEYIDGYDYFGWYDIDTLFGDVYGYVSQYLYEYDFISVGGKQFHNRLSGPFTLVRNTKELRELYRGDIFIAGLEDESSISAYEESTLNEIANERYTVKIISEYNLEESNGGKNTYDVCWSNGKIYIHDEEKMFYHFLRKNQTVFVRDGDIIFGKYDKKFVDDFYWIFGFTENYSETIPYLMDSIHKYSNRKCIIYSINFDYKPSQRFTHNNQFIYERIEIDRGEMNSQGKYENIISCKPKFMLDAIEKYPDTKFIFIDSDIYLTTSADDISVYFDKLTSYPLINSHTHDVVWLSGLVQGEDWSSPAHILAKRVGVDICVFPRRKTNIMLFDKRSKWFLEEQIDLYDKHRDTEEGVFGLYDEDSANVILSKYQLYDCIHLCDVEGSSHIDITKITDLNHPFNQTGISEHVILPKTTNDIAVFHGMKDSEKFMEIEKNYGNMVLDCEEMLVYYKDNTIFFVKNSFLTTKKIDENVDFIVKNIHGDVVIQLGNQELWRFFTFFVSDIHLNDGLYHVEIVKTNSRTKIYNNLLIV